MPGHLILMGMDSERVRAWWWRQQGWTAGMPALRRWRSWLAPDGRGRCECRSYLTLWPRGNCSRESIDRAVADASIHELPGARACSYVVPRIDAENRCIIWASFIHGNDQIRAAVRWAEAFVRDELGDARAMSLDSPERRRSRIEALRASA